MDPLHSVRVSRFPIKSYIYFAVVCWLGAVLLPSRVDAALIVYRNAALFAAATAGRTTNVVNFDSTAVGSVLTSSNYQGIVFGANPNIVGNLIVTDGSLAISNGLKAFSGTRFLGSDAGELITLGTNQSFSFSFQSNVSAVGMYIISESQLGSGEIGMRVGVGAGATSAVIDPLNGNEIALTGGTATPSFAYFIGIADTNTSGILPAITVFPGSTTASAFGIDNITSTITAVPEPASLLMISAAIVAGMGHCARRRTRKSLAKF